MPLEKLLQRLSCRRGNFRPCGAARREPGCCPGRVPWHGFGGRGQRRLLRGAWVQSDLLHLLGNSSSCRSLPLAHPKQIQLLCTSLLEAAAAPGHVLQVRELTCLASPSKALCPSKEADPRTGRGFGTAASPPSMPGGAGKD